MILSDRDITSRLDRGDLLITPALEPEQYQPASVDVRLGCEFVRFRDIGGVIDVRDGKRLEDAQVIQSMGFGQAVLIEPGEFVLGTTLERVSMPNDLAGRVEGRSSIGRLGLTVHVTAGFIDPGFRGNITLELANLNRSLIIVYTGMRIAQLAFELLSSHAERPYGHGGSKYQHQTSVTPSRIAREK